MKQRERENVEGNDEILMANPFAALDFSKIQVIKKEPQDPSLKRDERIVFESKKGRVTIRREKTGRSGKTVTILMGIESLEQRRKLLKIIQKENGCGGTLKDEVIEIQGDKRDSLVNALKGMGYQVVVAGG